MPTHMCAVPSSPPCQLALIALLLLCCPLQRIHAATAEASIGGGRTSDERQSLAETIRALAPMKLLVWGVGPDSVMLDAINSAGTTVFVEDVYPPGDERGMVRRSPAPPAPASRQRVRRR